MNCVAPGRSPKTKALANAADTANPITIQSMEKSKNMRAGALAAELDPIKGNAHHASTRPAAAPGTASEQALDQQQAKDPGAAGAQSKAHRNFAAAGNAAHQHQACDIRADDQ